MILQKYKLPDKIIDPSSMMTRFQMIYRNGDDGGDDDDDDDGDDDDDDDIGVGANV